MLAALAWLALAVMLFGRFTKRPGYIPDMRLSRRGGKWLLALRLARSVESARIRAGVCTHEAHRLLFILTSPLTCCAPDMLSGV